MSPPGVVRWGKFSAVGALGTAAQLSALAALIRWGVPYLPATALAVEFAILHNFVWHERWTWKDRAAGSSAAIRLARFNLSTGAVSLAVNLAAMRFLVGECGMPYMAANGAAIAAGAVANFLAADRFAFRSAGG
jgi:putative flippase GtrA